MNIGEDLHPAWIKLKGISEVCNDHISYKYIKAQSQISLYLEMERIMEFWLYNYHIQYQTSSIGISPL